MKFILKMLLALGVILGGSYLLKTIKQPAEGKIEVVKEEPMEEVVVEEVAVEEPMPVEPDPVPVAVDPIEVVEFLDIPIEVFKRKSKMKKFAKAYGGDLIEVSGMLTIKIGEIYYYKKDGAVYANYKGKETKL